MSTSDSELEEDEEEILVYVEFDNCMTNKVLQSESLQLDMLGIDTEHPVMQVNGKFYEGTYEDAVGTYLFFEKDDNPAIDDAVFDKIPNIKYYNKSRKLLKMQRAFVVPRYEVVGDSQHEKCHPNIETIKEAGVPVRYQDEALEFWKESRNNRIEALNEYLKKQEFRKELRLRGFEPESESDDDNPFAMYKQTNMESDMNKLIDYENDNVDYDSQIENLENTLQNTDLNLKETKKSEKLPPQKLNIIDPGPSTSKSSMPWVDDELSNEVSMTDRVKTVGRVREKTARSKARKKETKRKKVSFAPENVVDNMMDQSPCSPGEAAPSVQMTNDNLENLGTSDGKVIHKDNELFAFHVEEMEVDEAIVEESDRLLSVELGINKGVVKNKQQKKQERREAKMREISERLKSLSDSSSKPDS